MLVSTTTPLPLMRFVDSASRLGGGFLEALAIIPIHAPRSALDGFQFVRATCLPLAGLEVLPPSGQFGELVVAEFLDGFFDFRDAHGKDIHSQRSAVTSEIKEPVRVSENEIGFSSFRNKAYERVKLFKGEW